MAVAMNLGGWSYLKQPSVNLGGSWTPLSKMYANVSGVWKEVWPGTLIYTHTGTGYGLNIANLFKNPTVPANFIFINNGTIGGTGGAALSTGVFPPGSKLTIINNGRISGRGGKGGWFNADKSNTPGESGGDALLIQFPATVDNTYGTIYGGGGGGGGSAEWGGSNDNNAPGAGGAGIPIGQPGEVTWYPGYNYNRFIAATDTIGGSNYAWNPTRYINKGGNVGQAGQTGVTNIGSSENHWNSGGTAGAAIVGSGMITNFINPNAGAVIGAIL